MGLRRRDFLPAPPICRRWDIRYLPLARKDSDQVTRSVELAIADEIAESLTVVLGEAGTDRGRRLTCM